MAYLRSAVAAFVLWVPLLLLLWLGWAAVLIGIVEVFGSPGDAGEPVFFAILAFAVVSGLVLYFVLLWRRLDGMDVPAEERKWHLATTGLLPIAATLGFLWIVVSNLRIGF